MPAESTSTARASAPWLGITARRLDATLDAIAHAVVVASEKTAADALEYLCDYMNGIDAVMPEDVQAFDRWVERGRP